MMKRIVSMLLCVMMTASLAVFHASAEETLFSGEPEPVVPDDAAFITDGFKKTDADLASTGVTLDDPVIVPVSLDLNIQKELLFSALAELYDFVQRGDLRPRELTAEERSVIEVFDLVVGHFPHILVDTGSPL